MASSYLSQTAKSSRSTTPCCSKALIAGRNSVIWKNSAIQNLPATWRSFSGSVSGRGRQLQVLGGTSAGNARVPGLQQRRTSQTKRLCERLVLARSTLPNEKISLSSQGLSVQTATTALLHASRAWGECDIDHDGSLSLDEAVTLLNSNEVQDAMLLLTNVAPTTWTREELMPLFQRADHDKSGALSRSEFLALYLLVSTKRIKEHPVVLAEALLGFLDADRNGKIDGKELKVLLTMLGFPVAILLPIPSHFGVDYRSILRTLGSIPHQRVTK